MATNNENNYTELIQYGRVTSQTFVCAKCKRFSYFPQRYTKLSPKRATNDYEYCPYCGRKVTKIVDSKKQSWNDD